ncbi:MAG: hypothetical protein M9915_02985 [Rhizobacter sp.]|nr:hypothetical protein [Rhizobacter sp.]
MAARRAAGLPRLLAHARGEFARAAAAMGEALRRLEVIGGSHAQRDLFEQIQIDAAAFGPGRARARVAAGAGAASPASVRLRRLLSGQACATLSGANGES